MLKEKIEYTGYPNHVPDEPFARSKIEAAIFQLTRNTLPCLAGITLLKKYFRISREEMQRDYSDT